VNEPPTKGRNGLGEGGGRQLGLGPTLLEAAGGAHTIATLSTKY